jgi:hypothetical protein
MEVNTYVWDAARGREIGFFLGIGCVSDDSHVYVMLLYELAKPSSDVPR